MNKATKVALLSAFIFPGIGHIFLKKYTAATLFATSAFICSYLLLAKVVENTIQIIENIQPNKIPDAGELHQLILSQLSQVDLISTNIISVILIVTWVIATIDAYRIAKYQ